MDVYQIVVTVLFMVYVLAVVRRIGTGEGRYTVRETVGTIVFWGVLISVFLYIDAT